MRLAAALTAAICVALPAQAERITLTPADEAGRDATLKEFREDLRAAVAARETDAVIAAACDDIYLSHGSNGGHDELRQFLTVPPESLSEDYRDQADAMRELNWTTLETTLASAGYFNGSDEFWMPYHWQLEVPDGMDPFSAYFVDGTNVLMRDGPSRNGAVLDRLSHELLTMTDYAEDSEYRRIRLGDGREGYVHRDYLSSMVGYRAQFVRSENGEWLMCLFVGGD